MHLFDRSQSLNILVTVLFGTTVVSADDIPAGQIPAINQTWEFDPSDRCRLLAHKSVIIKNDKQHILVLDGGFGTFQTRVNGSIRQVSDLNPFTAAFDLSQDFATPGLYPSWVYKKPANSSQRFSITNHGGLWKSQDGNTIWYQGGHYYNADSWNDGLYHVNKEEIPEWQLWQMDVNNHGDGWRDVTNNTKGHELPNRTFAGVAVTVPELQTSYWVGGIFDRTTSAHTPNDTLQTTTQMLMYNETSSTITKQKYYESDSTEGHYQGGGLIHLPIGGKKGYLMSIMSLKRSVDAPWIDPDGESGNTEIADPVALDAIPLYDLETGEWIEQRTAWFLDQVPEPRTRFCTALFHDKTDNTWNLWVHGGQLRSNQNEGIREIYVLSMPSFIWSKVETTLSETNLIRSHSCHAVGSQLVIVGGYPPSVFEPTNVTCDSEYIKVLNIGENSISWQGSFSTNSEYKTPKVIRNVVADRKTPIAGFATTKLQADFEYAPKSSSGKTGAIAGGVVGGLVVVAVIGFFVWRWQKKKRAAQSVEAANPPQVIKDGNPPETRQTQEQVVEIAPRIQVPKPIHELESPTALRAVSPGTLRFPSPSPDYQLEQNRGRRLE